MRDVCRTWKSPADGWWLLARRGSCLAHCLSIRILVLDYRGKMLNGRRSANGLKQNSTQNLFNGIPTGTRSTIQNGCTVQGWEKFPIRFVNRLKLPSPPAIAWLFGDKGRMRQSITQAFCLSLSPSSSPTSLLSFLFCVYCFLILLNALNYTCESNILLLNIYMIDRHSLPHKIHFHALSHINIPVYVQWGGHDSGYVLIDAPPPSPVPCRSARVMYCLNT